MSQRNGMANTCEAFDGPLIYQKDGQEHAFCPSTGVFYSPPFSGAALLELLFPDDWSILPPG